MALAAVAPDRSAGPTLGTLRLWSFSPTVKSTSWATAARALSACPGASHGVTDRLSCRQARLWCCTPTGWSSGPVPTYQNRTGQLRSRLQRQRSGASADELCTAMLVARPVDQTLRRYRHGGNTASAYGGSRRRAAVVDPHPRRQSRLQLRPHRTVMFPA